VETPLSVPFASVLDRLLMASNAAELTLPDGFPLAPKGCEKPSQKFFDCFTAAGMQKDVAVRSQRPKNKACEA